MDKRAKGRRALTIRPQLIALWLISAWVTAACEDPPGVSVTRDPLDMGASAGAMGGSTGDSGLDMVIEREDPDLALIDMGGAERVDEGPLDEGPPDEDPLDQGPSIDPDAPLNEWLEACSLPATPLVEGAGGLYDQSLSEALRLGGPISGASLYVINPSESDLSARSYLALQGGRLERHLSSGQLAWVSEARGLTKISGVWDLNGDGSLEVVARGLRYAYVIQLSSGRTLWRSPERLSPEGAEVSSLGLLRVFDSGEQLRLYLADSGCGSAGSGDGALFDFRGGLSSPSVSAFRASDRLAGRCPAQHSAHSSERREGVMMVDSLGLHMFDATTGERALCGSIEGLPPQGNTMIAELSVSGSPAWLLTTPSELILVREQAFDPTRAPSCPEGSTSALLPAWRRELSGLIKSELTLVDLEGDGTPELLITSQDSLGWRSSLLRAETGELLAERQDLVILGALPQGGGELALLTADPQRVRLARLNRETLNAQQPSAEPLELPLEWLWAEALDGVTPLYSAPPSSWSSAFRRLMTLSGESGAQALVLKQLGEAGDELILTVDEEGVIAARGEGGPWRATLTSCQLSGCAQHDLLTLSGRDGQLLSLDVNLSPRGAAPSLPTGSVALAWSGEALIARSESGELSALLPPSAPSERWEERWRAYIGGAVGGLSAPLVSQRAGQSGVVVVPSSLDPSLITWEGRDAESGAPLWAHQLPRARWRALGRAVSGAPGAEGGYLYRHERMESPEAVEELNELSCEQTWLYTALGESGRVEGPLSAEEPRLFTQRAECPNRPMRPQVIQALELSTGRCVWRALISPHDDCYGPSGQALSYVELGPEGTPALYLTETSALRRLDPLTGELLSTQLIEESPVGQRRGGGRVTAVMGGAMRFGGNGPPELHPLVSGDSPAGSTVWRFGQLEGLRDQSWLYRQALGDERGAWVSLGASLPVARIDEQGELSALLSLQGVSDPQAPLLTLALTDHLRRGEEVRRFARDPSGDLVLSTLEGGHYVIQGEGEELRVSRFELLEAPLSELLWIDWDQDERAERVLAHSGGEVLIYQHSDLESPTALWVARCEEGAQCEGDIEGEERTGEPLSRADALCYAWVPLEGLSGAEVQLREEGGAALTDWTEAPLSGRGVLRELSLVPGLSYQVTLRGWVDRPEGRVYTSELSSQLVRFIDVTPPEVSLTEVEGRERLSEGESLQLSLAATDDVELTGWSVNIYASSGVRVRALGRGSLSGASFSRELSWDGSYSSGLRVPVGVYELRAAAVDSSGLSAQTSLEVTVE